MTTAIAPEETLTDRETQMVRAVAAGYNRGEIGELFNISRNTVNAHLRNVFAKVGAENQIQLVTWAVRKGLVTLE